MNNGRPDFIVIDTVNQDTCMLECKRYYSCDTLEQAYKKWKQSQRNQYEHFKNLKQQMGIQIHFAIQLKDRKKLYLVEWNE